MVNASTPSTSHHPAKCARRTAVHAIVSSTISDGQGTAVARGEGSAQDSAQESCRVLHISSMSTEQGSTIVAPGPLGPWRSDGVTAGLERGKGLPSELRAQRRW
jgi:hypothetical protein